MAGQFTTQDDEHEEKIENLFYFDYAHLLDDYSKIFKIIKEYDFEDLKKIESIDQWDGGWGRIYIQHIETCFYLSFY